MNFDYPQPAGLVRDWQRGAMRRELPARNAIERHARYCFSGSSSSSDAGQTSSPKNAQTGSGQTAQGMLNRTVGGSYTELSNKFTSRVSNKNNSDNEFKTTFGSVNNTTNVAGLTGEDISNFGDAFGKVFSNASTGSFTVDNTPNNAQVASNNTSSNVKFFVLAAVAGALFFLLKPLLQKKK